MTKKTMYCFEAMSHEIELLKKVVNSAKYSRFKHVEKTLTKLMDRIRCEEDRHMIISKERCDYTNRLVETVISSTINSLLQADISVTGFNKTLAHEICTQLFIHNLLKEDKEVETKSPEKTV